MRLFERQSNNQEYITYRMSMEQRFNFVRLDTYSKRHIRKFFNLKEMSHFLRYRFELLKQWIRQNSVYTNEYVYRLQAMIDKLWLVDELNSYEQEHVNHYLRVVFAQIRNLKNLIIDFPVNKNEKVYYRYEDVDLYKMEGDKLVSVVNNGEFYITTQKVLLAKQLDIFPIELSAIKEIKMSKQGMMLFTNISTFVFKTYDSYVLYVSLERIIRLTKKA